MEWAEVGCLRLPSATKKRDNAAFFHDVADSAVGPALGVDI